MKKLSKLKLHQLSKAELDERELSILRGGGTPGTCNCGCGGPSSTADNRSANNANGYTISYGYDGGTGGYTNSSVNNCGQVQGCIRVNTNWSCESPVNCNNAPNKC